MQKITHIISLNRIMIFVAFVGLGVSLYLWYQYAQPEPLVCVTDCQRVRESEYSSLFGVVLPVWGTLFYVSILVHIALLKYIKQKYQKALLISLGALTTGGFLFSLYLTYIEAEVIDAFCQWCVISAICSILLFVFTIIKLQQEWPNLSASTMQNQEL